MFQKNERKASRLTRLRDLTAGDGGFTLLEVLAVMVIVGLLAAITVPQIAKWREKAYITSLKTDARNYANAAEANYVDNSTYADPAADVTLNAGNAVADFAVDVGGEAYTFTVTSTKTDSTVTYDSDAAGSPMTLVP